MSLRSEIDWQAWLVARVEICNSPGQRQYDAGVRVFNCLLCRDTKVRGWANIYWHTYGCFNGGCEAEPKLIDGGLVEVARRLEGCATAVETLLALRADYPLPEGYEPVSIKQIDHYDDWVDLPGVPFNLEKPHVLEGKFLRFAQAKWGLTKQDLVHAQARMAVSGRHSSRIVFPVIMGGEPVGFQARHIGDAAAKYVTSKHGVRGELGAECGRHASAMLYGVDELRPRMRAVLLEGIANTIRFNRDFGSEYMRAFAILGAGSLSGEKLAMLSLLRLSLVIVALDSDAMPRAIQYLDQLEHWKIPGALGLWRGGKDAGDGAVLEAYEMTFADRVAHRCGERIIH